MNYVSVRKGFMEKAGYWKYGTAQNRIPGDVSVLSLDRQTRSGEGAAI